MASLLNKVIIITGASTGIGACIARYLAQFKPKLVLVARSPDKLKTVSERCVKAGCEEGNVITVTADMAKDEDLERVINDAVSAFGHLDVLVNNAASFAVSDVHHTTPAEFDRTMAVNIRAPFFLSQAAILHLKKTQGCIVNISSVAAHCGWDHMAAYSISKAALEQLTKVLAYELAPSNVRVNAAIVGFTKTDTMEDYAKFLRMDVFCWWRKLSRIIRRETPDEQPGSQEKKNRYRIIYHKVDLGSNPCFIAVTAVTAVQ